MCCFLVSYDAVMKYLPNVLRGHSVYANNAPLLFISDCVHYNFFKGLIEKKTQNQNKRTKTRKPVTQWSWTYLGKYLCCYCKLKIHDIAYRTDILVY